MDKTVQRLNALVTVNRHTFEHQSMITVTRHSKETEFLGQSMVCEIAVYPQILSRLGVRLPYLQKCIGKHRLKILLRLIAKADVPRSIGLCILLINDTVDRHTGTQDMISHEHVHNIEWVGIIVACTDLNTFLVDIVIPRTAIAIPLCALSLQVVEVVNTGSAEHVISLGKDGPLNHTLLGIIKGNTVAVVVIGTQVIGHGRSVRIIFTLNHEGVGISCCFEGCIEDAEVFLTLHTQLVISSTV